MDVKIGPVNTHNPQLGLSGDSLGLVASWSKLIWESLIRIKEMVLNVQQNQEMFSNCINILVFLDSIL